MRLIRCVLVNILLVVAIAILWRGYQFVAIVQTVAANHLVEKGNGKAWPATITGLFGEVTKTSDSLRKSADTMQSLLEKDGPQTAKSVRAAAAGVADTTTTVKNLLEKDGPTTAQSIRTAASALAGTSGEVQALLKKDGPATAQSIRDAAAGIAGTATSVQTLIAENGPQTAQSIREAADTAKTLLANEGPATAASVRKATDSGAEISANFAAISKDLKSWVDRMAAPPTVKQKIWAVVHALIIALAHAL